MFLDSSTVLPERIDSETSKRVNAIQFYQRQKDLVASVSFAFPTFSVKTFSLSEPERVVLDVVQTVAVKKETTKKKMVEMPPEKEAATAPEGMDLAQIKRQEPLQDRPDDAVEKMQEVVAKIPETPSVVEEEIVPVIPEGLPTGFWETQDDVSTVSKAEGEIGTEALPPVSDSAMEQDVKERWSFLDVIKKGPMERYLLSALVAISFVVVGLLVFVTLKKKRRMATSVPYHEYDEGYDGVDGFDDRPEAQEDDHEFWDESGQSLGKRIASLDTRIRDELNKL